MEWCYVTLSPLLATNYTVSTELRSSRLNNFHTEITRCNGHVWSVANWWYWYLFQGASAHKMLKDARVCVRLCVKCWKKDRRVSVSKTRVVINVNIKVCLFVFTCKSVVWVDFFIWAYTKIKVLCFGALEMLVFDLISSIVVLWTNTWKQLVDVSCDVYFIFSVICFD